MRKFTVVLALLGLAGCLQTGGGPGTPRTADSPYPGFTRVHASTLRHRSSDVAVVSAVFAGGTRALLPERALGRSDHLYLIDLDTAVRTRLDTPGLEVMWLYPAGDSVLVDPGGGLPGEPDPPHHRVHADGRVATLETIDVVTGYVGEVGTRINDEMRVQQLAQAGALDDLVRLDSQQHDARVRQDLFAPWRYFNDRWSISVNFVAAGTNALLDRHVQRTHVLDWQHWPEPALAGYRFAIQREPFQDYAGGTSNQRVLRLQVWQGERLLHDLVPREGTFHVQVRGRRLWLIGESADYIDLP